MNNGGLWSLIDEIYPYCGSSLNGALVKFKNAVGSPGVMTNHNFVGGDYAERGSSGGLTSDGSTKYLDTGLIGTSLHLNGHMCAYRPAIAAQSVQWCPIGVVTVGNEFLIVGDAGNVNTRCAWGQTVVAQYNPIATPGLWTVDRLGSSFLTLRHNGQTIALSGTATTGVLQAYNVFAFCGNNTGVATGFFAGRIGYHSVGASMTGVQGIAYYQAIFDLQSELGRQV